MHRKIRRTSLITALAAVLAAVLAGVPFRTGVAHAASVYPSGTPMPAPSTTGQRAANLATGWLGWNYRGVGGGYWHAPSVPEYWCSDFATYVWQQAGIAVPTIPLVANFVTWAKQNGRFSSNPSQLQVGDVIFYPDHAGVVVGVEADGTVQTADGDFGGERGWNAKNGPVPESYFAEHSTVELDTFNPQHGQGAGGTIVGVGLAD